MSRIIVTGGRDYTDKETIERVLAQLPHDSVIVHGAAPGADTLAHLAAKRLGLKVEPHPAKWKQHGKRAGILRNREMLGAGADAVIAFPGGNGTADMKRIAEEAGIHVSEIGSPVLLRHATEEPK